MTIPTEVDLARPLCLYNTLRHGVHALADLIHERLPQSGQYVVRANGEELQVGADNRVITPPGKELQEGVVWVGFCYSDLEVRNVE